MSQSDPQRVLRWEYRRGHEQRTCELTLNMDACLYELSVIYGTDPASKSVERFSHVSHAFKCQCQWEAAFLDQGWTLSTYESAIVLAPAHQSR
jgi:hypothetical protein